MPSAGNIRTALWALLKRLRRQPLGNPPAADPRQHDISHDESVPLPAGAGEVLRSDNAQLRRWREHYATLGLPVSRHTFWDPAVIARDLNLQWFRGDNAYVWQCRQLGANAPQKMDAMLKYVESRDTLGVLTRCREDGLFGCWTFPSEAHGRVSRDLLDSANEINFLERHIGLSQRSSLSIVDIGAGYGRLAHRFCTALPAVQRYDCLDAVPESTFLCDYYLRFRGLADRARAVPLTEAAGTLAATRYDIAVNIHSFPECTYEGVAWWLGLLRDNGVPYLLVVPNHADQLDTAELDGTSLDFAPLLAQMGFAPVAREPVLADEAVRRQVGVQDHFLLYRRR